MHANARGNGAVRTCPRGLLSAHACKYAMNHRRLTWRLLWCSDSQSGDSPGSERYSACARHKYRCRVHAPSLCFRVSVLVDPCPDFDAIHALLNPSGDGPAEPAALSQHVTPQCFVSKVRTRSATRQLIQLESGSQS